MNLSGLGEWLGTQRHRWALLLKSQRPIRYSGNIPVFIVCRDRVAPLRLLVEWLESEGMTNIILIDNDSLYGPMREYLAATAHTVIRLGRNVGHTSPWLPEVMGKHAKDRPFIVTDPDVIPDEHAHGAVRRFVHLLNQHHRYVKAGFGLRIDDIPDHYALKNDVIRWESAYWRPGIEVAPGVWQAPIDTTFALYRPTTPYVEGPALRTGGRYVARHEPWYQDSAHPTEEMVFYQKRANQSMTWGVRHAQGVHYRIGGGDEVR